MTRHKNKGGSFMSEVNRHIKGIEMAVKVYRTNLPPQTRAVLKENNNGFSPITEIKVCREPLKGVFTVAIDTIQSVDSAKYEPHDQLFHLYMVCTLTNGHKIRIEKEEDIKAKYYKKPQYESGFIIHIIKPLTILGMFQNTISRVGNKEFFHYDAFSDNCQKFIYDNLISNNIPLTQEQINFIMQKVDNLLPSWAKKLTGFFTDLANRGKTAIFGEGL
jgi:hypothetical protein